MKQYKDKNNNIIKDEDYVFVDERVCQALRCDDGTLLYEELFFNQKDGSLDLKDEPLYPDAYTSDEVEIIPKEKAIEILK